SRKQSRSTGSTPSVRIRGRYEYPQDPANTRPKGVPMAAAIEVKVPDIGDFKDVPVIEVLIKAGDRVKPEDPLVTLESDKATMDVPSPAAGTVKALKVKVGDKVSEGSVILLLETAGGARAAAPTAAPETSVPAPPAAASAPAGIAD